MFCRDESMSGEKFSIFLVNQQSYFNTGRRNMSFEGPMRSVFLSLSILPAILFLSACSAFKTEIRTSMRIEAPRDIVWKILVDLEQYPEWNPYHVRVVPLEDKSIGSTSEKPLAYRAIQKGEKLRVFIHKPNDKKIALEVKVLELEPLSKLYWGGGIRGVFKGEHRFILGELSATATMLWHDEDFQGLALPFIPLGPEYIEQGYELMNQAAKERAEAVYHEELKAPE